MAYCSISIANKLEILQSCTMPSISLRPRDATEIQGLAPCIKLMAKHRTVVFSVHQQWRYHSHALSHRNVATGCSYVFLEIPCGHFLGYRLNSIHPISIWLLINKACFLYMVSEHVRKLSANKRRCCILSSLFGRDLLMTEDFYIYIYI